MIIGYFLVVVLAVLIAIFVVLLLAAILFGMVIYWAYRKDNPRDEERS